MCLIKNYLKQKKIFRGKYPKKLTTLKKKGYEFLMGRKYLIGDDGSQNIFLYQLTPDALELKRLFF